MHCVWSPATTWTGRTHQHGELQEQDEPVEPVNLATSAQTSARSSGSWPNIIGSDEVSNCLMHRGRSSHSKSQSRQDLWSGSRSRLRVAGSHETSGNSAAVGPLGGPPPGMGKLWGSHSSGSSMLFRLLWHECCVADRPDSATTQPAQSRNSQKLGAAWSDIEQAWRTGRKTVSDSTDTKLTGTQMFAWR